MNKYPGSPKDRLVELNDAADGPLEFPIDPGFLSVPPRLDPQVMLRRLEETMPWRSTRAGEEERRLATKVNVQFVL